MIRRRRFQAKPMLGGQMPSQSINQPKELPNPVVESMLSLSNNESTEQNCLEEQSSESIAQVQLSKSIPISLPSVRNVTMPFTESLTITKSSDNMEFNNLASPSSMTSSIIKLSSSHNISSNNHISVIVDEDVVFDIVDEERIQNSRISSPDYIENNIRRPLKRKKKSALQDEDLDTKKFTLADLVDWRPKTENTLRKKWDEKRQKMLETMSNSGISPSSSVDLDVKLKPESKCAGPRVKINEKGEMVLDEESLVVTNDTDVNLWETVDDDLMPKKLNSMSFRKRCTRTVNWTVAETDLFYEVLSATGTDFGLMHEFISGRTRVEIKKKFHREEKFNDSRINDVLDNPTLLDETLYTRIERLKKQIQRELEEKMLAKQKPARSKRGSPEKS